MFTGGLLSPTLTPIDPDSLAIDVDRLANHCNWLLTKGCHGVVLFGTTGEATSFSGKERVSALDGILERGVPADRLMVGVGTCSLTETAELGRHALQAGVKDLLVLPPFYYKNPDDQGLIDHFEAVVARLDEYNPALHLYHIPPVAGVGFSVELVGKLREKLPQIVGIKDSSGDWNNTEALIRAHPGLSVFCGSEVFLLDTMRSGGAGCITATANINASKIRELYDSWQGDGADAQQEAITDFRKHVQKAKPVPAMKALLARHRADPVWNALRPPFRPLTGEQTDALEADLVESASGIPALS
jgi:4-hydroxy-tetrahydrodipicolinate synthase